MFVFGLRAGRARSHLAVPDFIAVPAAMRFVSPRADTSLGLALSLRVTLPFNVVVGTPLYAVLAVWLAGG